MVKLKEIRKKLDNYAKNKGKFTYVDAFRNKKIKKNHFVLESTHGDSFGGHNYYLVQEIKKKVRRSKIFVVVKNVEAAKKFFENNNMTYVNVIKHLSVKYYELIATSEYLINDTTFYPFFNKRKGQKYFIVWHGTPLKYMGKDMPVVVDVANVQRNFYMADKIFVSNEYTKDILIETYNMKNVYQGKIVVGSSPRNSIFLDEKKKENIRENLNIKNKKVRCYMPTWRGSVGKVKKSSHTQELLNYLEKNLDSNTVLYVKLHDFEKSSIDFKGFNKIKEFPNNYETYEFLSITDTLITDYSSVMYDYINVDKPVILYTYDYEEYIESRGLYEDIDKYPFKRVENLDDLLMAIENTYLIDYDKFKRRFTYSDVIDGANKILKNMLNNYVDETISEYSLHNGKETVAILSGGFWNNGVTSALINTSENIDTSKRNYICFFEKSKIKPEHYYKLLNLPENVLFYPITGEVNGSVSDRLLLKRYLWNEDYKAKGRKKQLSRIYREEFKRIFGDLKIDWFIHYTGFERKEAEMMKHIDSKKMIWVHTDMFAEYEAKKNFSKKIVFSAYQSADKVVMVHENLRDNLNKEISGLSKKLVTVNNFLGEERIRRLSKENVFETLSNVKVDYAFNDNAYKTETQMIVEEYKNEIKEIVESTKESKHTDYHTAIKNIRDINERYSFNPYISYIVERTNKMLNEATERISNIFGVENKGLIDELLFEEYYDYILPEIKDKQNELNYYFPNLENELKSYKAFLNERLDKAIVNKNQKVINNLENQFKNSRQIVIEKYKSLKKEEDLKEKFNSLFENEKRHIKEFVEKNITPENIQGSQNPSIDFYSYFRVSKIKMLNAIFDDNITVYINIGRYDYQKGHDKLIEAFENTFEQNPNIFLVIVAPHGPLKSKTINRVRSSFARDSIVILTGINNPYPLLAYCDAFVLSSNYEGLGLVVYEALAVNTDVITVNLKETIQYMEQNQAIIVENSVEGLTNGFMKHLDLKTPLKKFDFEPLKIKSNEEFESLFK